MPADVTAVDLFCGAGGAACGAHHAGVTVLAGVDHDETALETYAANLNGQTIHHDLRDVEPEILPLDSETIDWVHGSPPCKGFSHAKGKRNPEDTRNSLVFSFIDWIEALQPRVCTMENVTGITNITDDFMETIEAAFEDAGYWMCWTTLNAANYGVPQKRKRVICLALREDLPWPELSPETCFPTPTHAPPDATQSDADDRKPWRTIRDAIGDLLLEEDGGALPNHDANPLDLPSDSNLLVTDQINEAHQLNGRRPLHSIDKPANTVRAGTPSAVLEFDPDDAREKDPESVKRSFDDDPRIRRLSERECARLQSFPDDFEFRGGKTAVQRQIGNAIPPRLQRHIAERVCELVERTRRNNP